jgi:serine protease Do
MTRTSSSSKRKPFTTSQLVLLASAAGLSAVVLMAGPDGYHTVNLAWDTSAQAAEATQRPAGFADLAAKVRPAVISVRVKIDQTANLTSMSQSDKTQPFQPFAPSSPFEKFFRQFGFPNMPNSQVQRHEIIIGEGSGFFISADGYAVTNDHVVDNTKSLQATTDDGTTYTAKVIGSDPKTDLALIKVDGKRDFPYVKFADHKPRIGDWVLAVGNPFGLGGTVTAGIVSAEGRDIGSGPYDNFIQIDAPINKGNSGGPTFNMNGNVVGVNTAIYTPSGGSVGIGFDIPADTAKMVVTQLKDKGYVTRGWLGVQIQSVTPGIADSLGLKQAGGAIVDEPQAGSPAAKAGIKAGDVIIALNGTPVKDSGDLAREVAMSAPGSSVKLQVLHKGQSKTITLRLGEIPEEQRAKAVSRQAPDAMVPHLGLMLAPAAGEVAGSGNEGVVVTGVEPNSAAANQGFETGDVILDVGGKAVASVSDVRKALAEAETKGRHDVLMRVKMLDGTRFVAMPLANA